jgi:pimeloyl-ACP methyl ester carboxylesterase
MESPDIQVPHIEHRSVRIDGVEIFYRETGPRHALPLLLLHGFPSASHQFRRLMDALGTRFRLIAPDYPGFGHSDAPAPSRAGGGFRYSFEHLADYMGRFCDVLGLTRCALYMFDFGGPVGFRLAVRHPGRIAGLIVQNANAYEEGLSDAARKFIALRPDQEGAVSQVLSIMSGDFTRQQYVGGTERPELVAPESWTLDQHFLELPGRKDIQVELAFDYKENVAAYPAWQDYLRRHRPPMLIVWGSNDPFFTPAGARAYLRDVPAAQLHLFQTGHFALEEKLPQIAPLVAGFLLALQRGEA